MHVRHKWITRGVAAVCVAAMIAPVTAQAQPDPVYQGLLTPGEAAEVSLWAGLYWARVDAGGVPDAAAAGFSFSNAAMNSPLFNPLRSARATLEKVAAIDAAACDGLNQFGMDFSVEVEAQRLAIRKVMLDGTIETDFNAEPAGSLEHLSLITATPAEAGLAAWFDGNTLVSVNLPLKDVSEAAYAASLAMNLPGPTQDLIGTLINSGAAWAAAAGSVTEWQAVITGLPSAAENFAGTAQQYLVAAGIPGGTATVVRANFGVYGEFPAVVILLPDALLLMDPFNGNLSGPFERDSAFDVAGLLSAHPTAFAAGTGVRYISESGCPIVAAPYPVPGPNPALPTWPGILPGHWIPQSPRPTDPPGTLPGRPTPWICVNVTMVGGATCVCTRTVYHVIGNIDPNHPTTVPIRIPEVQTCSTVGFCGGGRPPAAPIGAPPGCTSQYWY